MPLFASLSTKTLTVLAAALLICSFGSFLVGGIVLSAALQQRGGSPGGGGGIFRGLGGGDAARPGFKSGRPVGLFLMTRYWIATGSLEKAVWYFTPDGRAYLNPDGPFDDASLAAHKGSHGVMEKDGDDLIVKWADGKETRSPMDRSGGDGFAWDTGLFAPVESFDDSSELVGAWEGGESLSFSGASTITSRTLNIRADGTFSREAIASMRTESDGSVATAGSQGTSGGKWELDGYTLTMTYGNGEVARGVSFPFDDEATPIKPDRFYFGGTLYKKQS